MCADGSSSNPSRTYTISPPSRLSWQRHDSNPRCCSAPYHSDKQTWVFPVKGNSMMWWVACLGFNGQFQPWREFLAHRLFSCRCLCRLPCQGLLHEWRVAAVEAIVQFFGLWYVCVCYVTTISDKIFVHFANLYQFHHRTYQITRNTLSNPRPFCTMLVRSTLLWYAARDPYLCPE